uniref:phosphorylase b kinase gamma catalytic chain, liver/testis isoform-like isoform X1 n=2 Tax=Myxine glutinosa TaxID=7769 RepID=UPI00358FA1F0
MKQQAIEHLPSSNHLSKQTNRQRTMAEKEHEGKEVIEKRVEQRKERAGSGKNVEKAKDETGERRGEKASTEKKVERVKKRSGKRLGEKTKEAGHKGRTSETRQVQNQEEVAKSSSLEKRKTTASQVEQDEEWMDPRSFYLKYEPREVIGCGMSSVVRRCLEKATGREFAVKIIDIAPEKFSADQALYVRIATHGEVEILRSVAGHQNIISLKDFYESRTAIFLVFDLMKRGELFDYLTEKVALSEKATRKVMHSLLGVVSFLHSCNIIHRDLKPENILLDDPCNNFPDDPGSICLSDFGFACRLDPGETLQELYGTPGYLAPEMLACSLDSTHPGYGKPIDVWACGVIMFTLLAGSPPVWSLKQVKPSLPRFPSLQWDDKSPAAKQLICGLLEVDPSRRLLAEQALSHPFFHPHRMPAPLPRTPRHRLRVLQLVVLAVVFLGGGPSRARGPLTRESLARDPYSVRCARRLLDSTAFSLYARWVRRGQGHGRAALFENVPVHIRQKEKTTK